MQVSRLTIAFARISHILAIRESAPRPAFLPLRVPARNPAAEKKETSPMAGEFMPAQQAA
jgi:hypothetical protein